MGEGSRRVDKDRDEAEKSDYGLSRDTEVKSLLLQDRRWKSDEEGRRNKPQETYGYSERCIELLRNQQRVSSVSSIHQAVFWCPYKPNQLDSFIRFSSMLPSDLAIGLLQ